MSYAPPTKTWGEVAQSVRRTFGDESGVQLEDGDLLRWINLGQYEICRQNKILKRRGTQQTTPGLQSYVLTLPEPILQIESIRYDGRRLIPTEFTTVDANLEEYPPDAKGEPQVWYRWGDEVTLWPAPKRQVGLELYYTAAPKAAVALTPNAVLAIPDEYFLSLIDFVLAKLHEMDENPESQQVSLQAYAERMASMNDEARAGQSLTFQTITIVD